MVDGDVIGRQAKLFVAATLVEACSGGEPSYLQREIFGVFGNDGEEMTFLRVIMTIRF